MEYVHLSPRAAEFPPTAYYRFYNAVAGVNKTLSAGQAKNTNGVIGMNTAETFSSSENWQLYYQQGRYFIRNYDYGGGMQLGISADSPVVPKLLPRSGTLGQQWTLEQLDDGTYAFHNGLLGNSSVLALAGGNTQPGMQTSRSGARWEVIPNPSAKEPTGAAMKQDVIGFEVEQVSSSISSSATQTPSSTVTTPPQTTGPSRATDTAALSNTSPVSDSASSSSLPTGAIAGIAVGAVVILALIGVISYILWARKKPKPEVLPSEMDAERKMYYAHVGEVQHPYATPVQLSGEQTRYEMPGK